ncbi:MAG: gamma-glutamylcyclotransferase family protein, partial [Brevirhabdus sp.]
MKDPFFFGYGSLVNRRTHDYANAHRAVASGWRRAWRATDLRKAAFLTVLPDPATRIDGLIAEVPGGDWAALDKRERAYDKHDAAHAVDHPLRAALDLRIYAIPEGRHFAPTPEHPILLSYLDVVLQGYLAEFGERGVLRFLGTTDGWQAPVLDDRAAPLYPRAQTLTRLERAFVDDTL